MLNKKNLFLIFIFSCVLNKVYPLLDLFPEVTGAESAGKVRIIIENRTNFDLGEFKAYAPYREDLDFYFHIYPRQILMLDIADLQPRSYSGMINLNGRIGNLLLRTEPRLVKGIVGGAFQFCYFLETPIKMRDGAIKYQVRFEFYKKEFKDPDIVLRSRPFVLYPGQADIYFLHIILDVDSPDNLDKSCMHMAQVITNIH